MLVGGGRRGARGRESCNLGLYCCLVGLHGCLEGPEVFKSLLVHCGVDPEIRHDWELALGLLEGVQLFRCFEDHTDVTSAASFPSANGPMLAIEQERGNEADLQLTD